MTAADACHSLPLVCRAAKLEGDTPPALRQATGRARRIQIAWLLCNLASAILCACMGALDGWAQLQLCCIAALWLVATSTLLEYLMACIVHSTTEAHLGAMHSLVRHSVHIPERWFCFRASFLWRWKCSCSTPRRSVALNVRRPRFGSSHRHQQLHLAESHLRHGITNLHLVPPEVSLE